MDALAPENPQAGSTAGNGTIRGLVSPHIDYQRGGLVYAQVWRAAAQAAREAELREREGSNLESQPDLALDPPEEPKVKPMEASKYAATSREVKGKSRGGPGSSGI